MKKIRIIYTTFKNEKIFGSWYDADTITVHALDSGTKIIQKNFKSWEVEFK